LKREIITTSDGSTTIHLPEWNESYHSRHGAIQEAYHVFINSGLSLFENKPVSILEIGFGTGLNAFITFLKSETHNQQIDYTGVEAYPVSKEEAAVMNYADVLKAETYAAVFQKMHQCEWNVPVFISKNFSLIKRNQFFDQIALCLFYLLVIAG
jgi:tRNA U34 5-methylaminomethyl-2-thiouridine-forming methyltransferase MnmC